METSSRAVCSYAQSETALGFEEIVVPKPAPSNYGGLIDISNGLPYWSFAA
jgi:hypothetical protein